jgi:hypothetical protein
MPGSGVVDVVSQAVVSFTASGFRLHRVFGIGVAGETVGPSSAIS